MEEAVADQVAQAQMLAQVAEELLVAQTEVMDSLMPQEEVAVAVPHIVQLYLLL
jgi:hypothetical protein